MQISDFELERFFARWEFKARYNLCASDVEPVLMSELLALADGELSTWWDSLSLGYTETAGHPRLRSAIANLYSHVHDDDVTVCSGGQEGIFLTMHAVLSAGDHVIALSPSYQSLHEVARSLGAAVTLLELHPEDDWQLDVDRLRKLVRGNTRAVVLNYPHNPTGALLRRADFDTLCGLADELGFYIINDEVYRGLELNEADRLPQIVDATTRGISINVMTKRYGLGGLRIGWVAARDHQVLQRIGCLHDYTTICASAPSEVLAVIGLRNSDELTQRAQCLVRSNLPIWESFFAANAEHLEWSPPRGGSVAFPRVRRGSADDFVEGLVEETGVLLIAGSKFSLPGQRFRVGLGRRGIEQGLAVLQEYLQKLC